MKLAFLTLAAVHAQRDESKKGPSREYTDFENGDFVSCSNNITTFSSFESEDGLRIGVKCVIQP